MRKERAKCVEDDFIVQEFQGKRKGEDFWKNLRGSHRAGSVTQSVKVAWGVGSAHAA